MTAMPSWQPTHAHLRALVLGLAALIAGIVLGRPDVVVLGTPLLMIGMWAGLARPRVRPAVSTSVAARTLREGDVTAWRAEVRHTPGLQDLVGTLAVHPWLETDPHEGSFTASSGRSRSPVVLRADLRSMRWGRRPVGPVIIAGTSAWGAFRWGPVETEPIPTTTLPVPAVYDSRAPSPHPTGLVGMDRSAHHGDGSEFASIRPFQTGDRLRRIHWPVSLRTDTLHVKATWSDQDTNVVLLVDALNDLGDSGGIDGAASSLDVTVRAAGALAEHFLRRGDRVGVRSFGSRRVTFVPSAAGTNHLRRILHTLAGLEAATDLADDGARARLSLTAGTLVILLSPLVSPTALEQAVTLGRRGLSVVVVDTLPPGLAADDEAEMAVSLAWRLRKLQRAAEMRHVSGAGIPIVAWQGSGSLDRVLRDLRRRRAAPRLAHR